MNTTKRKRKRNRKRETKEEGREGPGREDVSIGEEMIDNSRIENRVDLYENNGNEKGFMGYQ